MFERKEDDASSRKLRIAGMMLAAGVVVGAAIVLIVRSQIARHRRDLFSSSVLERLAALGFMAREPASVESITLLRDFLSWERRALLRARARVILDRMEAEAEAGLQLAGEKAG